MLKSFVDTKIYRRARYALLHVFFFVIAVPLAAFLLSLALNIMDMIASEGFIPSGLIPDPIPFRGLITLALSVAVAVLLRRLTFRIAPAIVALFSLRDAGRFAAGGNSRFAGLFEDYVAIGGQIFYGASLFNPNWFIGSSRDDQDQHMITIGGSGSGKGTTAIIPNLLEWYGSAIVVDPKGTNAHVTANYRNNAVILDPFRVVDLELIQSSRENPRKAWFRKKDKDIIRGRFNPLDLLDPDDPSVAEEIGNIAEALIIDTGAKDKYFIEAPRMLVKGYIAHLISTKDDASLNDLYSVISAPSDVQEAIHINMANNPSCGGLARLAASEIENSGGATALKNIYSAIRTQLSWLGSGAIAPVISETNFDIMDLVRTNYFTLYVVLPPDKIKEHRVFLRLVLAAAFNVHMKERKTKGKTLFLIDEAPQLGRLEVLEQGFSLARSYGLVMWPFFQSKSQIDEIYGKAGDSFFTSARATQVFGVSGSDAQWAAEMLGTRGLIDEVTRTSGVMGLRDANSVTREIGASSGKQYIFRRAGPHLLLERTPYYSTQPFASCAGIDPDHPNLSPAMRRGRSRFGTQEELIKGIGTLVTIAAIAAAIGGFIAYQRSEPPFQMILFTMLPALGVILFFGGGLAIVTLFEGLGEGSMAKYYERMIQYMEKTEFEPDSWRHRFKASFGSSSNADISQRDRQLVFSEFLDHMSSARKDHVLANTWDEKFRNHERLSQFNGALGKESLLPHQTYRAEFSAMYKDVHRHAREASEYSESGAVDSRSDHSSK